MSTTVLTGCLLLVNGCESRRTTRVNTPTAPSGPVQTASNDGNVVPAGTVLPVRTNQTIATQRPGSVYDAQLAREVVSRDYDVIIPKGSRAELVVVETDTGGTVGTPEIVLALRSVTIHGQTYAIDSAGNVQTGEEGLGRNRRTGKMVGGGAVLGTVIGAIAGGATGAAIGAAAGAGAGATAQVLTRGDEVNVPAETVLSFRIQQPIRLST